MEIKKGKVSICITTYNRPKLLRELLESILIQSYQNFEIIITDNSNNTDTKEMVKKINSNKIKYIKNDRNIGMGKNALKAFSYVDGEFMTFTPDDDLWNDKTKIEKQVKVLNQYKNINIVYSNANSIDYNGNLLDEFTSIYDGDEFKFLKGEELLPGNETNYFLNILTAMLRSEKLLNIFKESYHYNSEEYLCYYIGATEEEIGFISKKLVSLREAEHYREVEKKGKILDWKKAKDIRIKQILGIFSTLINLHPETCDKLETQKVELFLGKHIIRTAIQSKNIFLILKTIFSVYLFFEEFSLIKAFKLKNNKKKSFG
ncbi:hypothetical protein OSSY52_03600 [Tepiditoga spiralis]|uniref:Glycosyltransferase 2-like domain-containing protein n=1 Tax=Tepiditoga spiralis TaxID=2108365 RepID=A0A7G1GA20_9BACT|nr:glycosyltransferase [Tepiditoga spiralis]BBE30219.1 hypothetical protein OSSY52_03600 [Tepiditoga spiralis]